MPYGEMQEIAAKGQDGEQVSVQHLIDSYLRQLSKMHEQVAVSDALAASRADELVAMQAQVDRLTSMVDDLSSQLAQTKSRASVEHNGRTTKATRKGK